MLRLSPRRWALFLIGLVLAGVACGQPSIPVPAPTDTRLVSPSPEVRTPEAAHTIEGPAGVRLTFTSDALDPEAPIQLRLAGTDSPFPRGSPFEPIEPAVEVDLGGAELHGEVILSIPLPGSASARRAATISRLFVAQTRTPEGTPVVIGATEGEGEVHFPVMGSQTYMLHSISLANVLLALAPLQVPQYPQRTPAWCVPTAVTDVAQYHQGVWPAGGLGSVWGESSNWYLGGKAGQPFDQGSWFHGVVQAGGYPVPDSGFVPFGDETLEIMVWNWGQPGWGVEQAETLWQAFRLYVQRTVWGLDRPARPVAWTSNIETHARVITGSTSETYFVNEPSVGGSTTGVNVPHDWETYHQEILDLAQQASDQATAAAPTPTLGAGGGGGVLGPFETIATLVLLTDPRPEAERRGVLWLTPATQSQPGAVALRRGTAHTIASGWNWDGAGQHDLGYYYDDRLGGLPTDPVVDHAFTALSAQDDLLLSYSVVNIDDKAHTYHVAAFLLPEGGGTSAIFSHDLAAPIGPGEAAFDLQATLPLAGLPPGQHVLKFVLSLEAVVQDTKFVSFRLTPAPPAFTTPVLSTPVFYSGPDSCGPTEVTFELTTSIPGAQGMLLAYRLWDVARDLATEWSVEAMNPLGQGSFRRVFQAGKDIRGLDDVERGWMQYQFIATGADGQALARTQVYGDLAFAPCGGGLPPLRLITPTPVTVR